jgi:CheY-like chemotaxis protein
MDTATVTSTRTVMLASADASLRQRLNQSLSGLRWQVREAGGGADALAQLERNPTEALILDYWLPDLEVIELAGHLHTLYPGMEMLRVDGDPIAGAARSPRRNELLHALREALEISQRRAPELEPEEPAPSSELAGEPSADVLAAVLSAAVLADAERTESTRRIYPPSANGLLTMVIEDMVGASAEMLELTRMIRLVAPRRPAC